MFGSTIDLLFPKTEKRAEVCRAANHTRSVCASTARGGQGAGAACPTPGERQAEMGDIKCQRQRETEERERWRGQRQREMGETQRAHAAPGDPSRQGPRRTGVW